MAGDAQNGEKDTELKKMLSRNVTVQTDKSSPF